MCIVINILNKHLAFNIMRKKLFVNKFRIIILKLPSLTENKVLIFPKARTIIWSVALILKL